MAAFSRLQLAKALIEYDNDVSNPNIPRRNADQSAIFAHLRRTFPSRQMTQTASTARRSTDYLGVALPVEGDSSDSASQHTHRKSQASIDALRNPFGRDSTHEGHADDEEIEVDLSSWGLDAFAPTDKGSKKKMKGKEGPLPNPHPVVQDSVRRRTAIPSSRTMSMGNLEQFGEGGAFLDSESSVPLPLGPRRYSVGSPLDYVNVEPQDPSLQQHARRASGHTPIDSIPTTPPLHAVQFPSSEPSALPSETLSGPRPSSRASLLDPGHGRRSSLVSMGTPAPGDETNSFALPPPSPDRASRFDPKYMRSRTVSNGTLGTQMLLNDVDAEAGTERNPETPSYRAYHNGGPYSRLDLMRPKVLIMPSPLQGSATQPQVPQTTPREGFQINTIDGPPLPPAARTGRRSSISLSVMEPSPSLSPSNSYGFTMTPNPRASMTLSQLTFRNNLMVDGQRDVAFADIDDNLKRATEDGEQADLDILDQQPIGAPSEMPAADEAFTHGRGAGKLYGTSLIDRLQARKAEMKGKQRVFRGDERPSMMARTPMQRSSTLIDPESLKQRPISRRFETSPDVEGLARRKSQRKTLINFDDEIPGAPKGHLGVDHHPLGAPGQTKSVFGVDTIWERELAKLHEIEAREKEEEEDRKRREAEEAPGGKKKKGRGRHKGKGRERNTEGEPTNNSSTPNMGLSPTATPGPEGLAPTSSNQQTSPVDKRGALKRPPPPPAEIEGDEEQEDSDSSSSPGHQPNANSEENAWHSESDDEGPRRPARSGSRDPALPPRLPNDEFGPRRTTGSGPRRPNLPPRLLALQSQGQLQLDDDDEDSEEDLPLVATIGRAAQRATRIDADESSEEDEPLTALLDKRKTRLTSFSVGGSLFDTPSAETGDVPPASGSRSAATGQDEDEDDKPLGLRVSRAISGSQHLSVNQGDGNDDDDKPLGLHPDQLRRSQFFAAAQAAQQQQMMMQAQAAAQLHQSMMFGASSLMSAPFYGPPMAPPMMVSPQLPPTPPPVPDTVKLHRVDKWRHDVAVEGQPSSQI